MSKDPKELVQEMVRILGKRKTERLLVMAKMSSSVAGKLIRGTYESTLGEDNVDKIARAYSRMGAQAS